MKPQYSMLLGALRYEFRMQVRRPSLWITFIVITALLFLEFNQGAQSVNVVIPHELTHYPLLAVIANWTFNLNTYLPICIGALLADRHPRDRRTKVEELLTTLPVNLHTRLVGKYLGSMLATLLPMFLIYAGFIGYILYLTHNLLVIPLALETFAVIALPGVLFVSAFSIAVPAILWTPLYQFLFICYWFWGTLWFHKDVLNLGRTILAPNGLYMVYGFYGFAAFNGTSPHGDPGIPTSPLLGMESIFLLIGSAILVLFVLGRLLKLVQAHQ